MVLEHRSLCAGVWIWHVCVVGRAHEGGVHGSSEAKPNTLATPLQPVNDKDNAVNASRISAEAVARWRV
jgi:hypothetical protein